MSGPLSRPTTKAGRLQRAALEALHRHEQAGDIPTSIRFLFYELEQAGVVDKARTGARRSDQDLTDAITHLRKIGLVPWDWIEDETRSLHVGHVAATVAGWIEDMLPQAEIDPWAGDLRPLILTESRATGGVLYRTIGRHYRCAVAPTNGQAHGFLVTEIAPLIQAGDWRVLYVGDKDDQGEQIEANSRRVLEQHAGSLNWERVALTEDQVEHLRQRGIRPILKLDRRYKNARAREAFECEALGQGILSGILRSRLNDLLPEPLDNVLGREAEERKEIMATLEAGR